MKLPVDTSAIAFLCAVEVWVPVIRSKSCDLRILMDQPTDSISS